MLPEAITDVIAGERRWVVIEGSNAGYLPQLADRVDHVICDPPYDAKTHANVTTLGSTVRGVPSFGALEGFEFVPQLIRAAKRWVVCFCALEQLGGYQAAAGEEAWIRAGVWDRVNGTPQLTGDRPAQGADGLAIMHRPGMKRWNRGGHRGIWHHTVERVERFHPTPKPVGLMLELVAAFTDPGDVVLDPFCGSATTGVACLVLGRRFIGIERDPEFARVAAERLCAEAAHSAYGLTSLGQLGLFATRPAG